MKLRKALLQIFFLLLFVKICDAGQIVDYTFTSQPDSLSCQLNLPTPKDAFNANIDNQMCIYVAIANASVGESIQFKWYYEDTLYGQSDVITITNAGNCCRSSCYNIRNTDIQYMTGYWYVEIYYNGVQNSRVSFYLEGIDKPFSILDHTVTATQPECSNDLPPVKTSFDVNVDNTIYATAVVDGVKKGDNYCFKWYFEGQQQFEGQVYSIDQDMDPSSSYCFWEYLAIKGTQVENMTGNWSVDFYFNGAKKCTDTFYLEGNSTACAAAAVLNDEKELKTLRLFRDKINQTVVGRAFVKLYYNLSPKIIAVLEDNPSYREPMKKLLKCTVPIVTRFLSMFG